MSTLIELVTDKTDLGPVEVNKLHALLGTWQLLADLSFADLLLWCRLEQGGGYICVGHMRPYTSQTLHPEDVFGRVLRPEELPIVDRAFAEGTIWTRHEPLLIDGLEVRMEAIPVPLDRRVVGVITKEGAPLIYRRAGELETNYLQCADALGRMIQQGTFPFAGDVLDPELLPRVGDGLIRLDGEGRVRYASPNAVSAYRRLGIVSNLVGERLDDLEVTTAAASVALALGLPAEGDVELGKTVVLQRAIPLVEGPAREIRGAIVLVRDVTELRHQERMLQMKEAVIREIHHRVKNNLQTIASLLRLQARRLAESSARSELEEAVHRIASIAIVHETLARDTSDGVDFGTVARHIIDMVRHGLTSGGVAFEFDGEPGELPAEQATPLAVALVELLQNAVMHAFNGRGGTVTVRMSRKGDRLTLDVKDDGPGLPAGFSRANEGLGLQIVRALAETELGGSMELESSGGTRVLLDLPARTPPRRGPS